MALEIGDAGPSFICNRVKVTRNAPSADRRPRLVRSSSTSTTCRQTTARRTSAGPVTPRTGRAGLPNGEAAVPTGKLRKVAISLRVIRALQEHMRLKGRALTAHIEAIIERQLEQKSGA